MTEQQRIVYFGLLLVGLASTFSGFHDQATTLFVGAIVYSAVVGQSR